MIRLITIENDRNCKKIKILKKESVRNNTEYPLFLNHLSHFHFFGNFELKHSVFAYTVWMRNPNYFNRSSLSSSISLSLSL